MNDVTELDASAGLSHGDLEPVRVPMQRGRAVPWAIAAAALLVLGSVAFLRFASAGGTARDDRAQPATPGSQVAAPTTLSRGDASLAAASVLEHMVEPRPPQVGLSLAPEPQPPSTSATATPATPRTSKPPVHAPSSTTNPPSATSASAPTPPLPLDEHPI